MASVSKTTFDLAASEYLRTLIARKQTTQKRLAEAAGISEPTMWNYYKGKTSMTLGTLRKFLEELGVSPAEAFEEIDRIQVRLEKSEGK
jgi:transcriptional regulator with XRE-family HTH domain